MHFKSTVVAAVAACLATSVSAHMKMSSPKPYGASDLNNSPLAADGSDFPCKLRPNVYNKEGAENIMAIGEPQTLSFIGGATHGGGSCQVSLTTDLQPTKNSKWMVIKSIEGGCPSAFNGNLNDDASSTAATSFQYTIPDGIAPGEYTIAWSWINKIGNREFYMNCGPATVVGSRKKRYAPTPKTSKRQASFPDMFVGPRGLERRTQDEKDIPRTDTVEKRQSTFPSLFVANLQGINSCTTPEGFDYHYPNPGADVQEAGSGSFTQLACGAGGDITPQQPTATGEAPKGPTGSAIPDSQSEPAAPTTFLTQTRGAPGVFVTGAASSAPADETSAPVPTPSGGGASDNAGTGSNGTSGPSFSSVAGEPGSPCSPEGEWSCASDGQSFQRCASGTWSAVMKMTQGMTCSPGVSSNIAMTPSKNKRNLHRHLRHILGLREPSN